MPRTLLALALVTLTAACGRDGPTPEQREARNDARIVSCIAEELQARGRMRLAQLDTMMAQSGVSASAARAPHTFAQVYATLAEVRAHETAYLDSAVHAEARADSVRFDSISGTFRVQEPSPGSVEENVRRSYMRDFAAARLNPDHPCNRLVERDE